MSLNGLHSKLQMQKLMDLKISQKEKRENKKAVEISRLNEEVS